MYKCNGMISKCFSDIQELIKSANLLFGSLDSCFIWDYCGKQFEKASCQRFRINDTESNAVNYIGTGETTVIEMCAVVNFLLDVVSIETYVETSSEHLPNLFKSIIGVLTLKCGDLTAEEVTNALDLSKKLLSKVQPAWNVWDMQRTSSTSMNGDPVDTATQMWRTMRYVFVTSLVVVNDTEVNNISALQNGGRKRSYRIFESTERSY